MSAQAYADYVLVEQVRLLENNQVDSVFAPSGSDFDQALVARARQLSQDRRWQAELDRPTLWYRRAVLIAVLMFALLGIVAVGNALATSGSQAVLNIYWLLLVLLGFNTLSLILWLLGCSSNIGELMGGSFGKLPVALQNGFARFIQSRQTGSFSAWQASMFGDRVGVWRFSVLSHCLWLSYLTAGLLALIVLLMFKQYDFIWGSTLLSADSFVALTRGLSVALQWLGISLPDAAQISASQSGALSDGLIVDAQSRRQWAVFLIASVFVYGIVPRLLGLLVAEGLLGRAEKNYRPDFYLPYYVELRHLLIPESGVGKVIDADELCVDQPDVSISSVDKEINTLTEGSLLIGYELNDDIAVPLDINIVGRDSFAIACSRLQQDVKKPVAVIVDAGFAPDRGTTRKLAELLSSARQRHLLIYSGERGERVTEQRLAAWYQTAQTLDFPLDAIQLLNRSELDSVTAK